MFSSKKLPQDHGFIDFLNANPNMDTVMEKTISIAIHRAGTKLTPDRSKFTFKEVDFFQKKTTPIRFMKINSNFEKLPPPLTQHSITCRLN